MADDQIIPHLFRTEYSKIVAVLCKKFGFREVEIAEDIASDTFLTATQAWGLGSIPGNPTAWLYTVAANKAKNYLSRKRTFEQKVSPAIQQLSDSFEEIDLSEQNILDSQLEMMFAICHPSLSPESQISLSLRLLSGFGLDEIAAAFFTTKETIHKRLQRAKQKLQEENIELLLPPERELPQRLQPVLHTLYLLFNEGYYSSVNKAPLRQELCYEAIRLCSLLAEHPYTQTPDTFALLALMCFHASRFPARTDAEGELILYDDQDRSQWNPEWIQKGMVILHRSGTGHTLSKFHLEAGIAYWHTQPENDKNKWENVLDLYDRLLRTEYNQLAELNRLYALSKVQGKEAALEEALALKTRNDRFYHLLLGELYSGIDSSQSLIHWREALQLAQSAQEAASIRRKMESMK